MKNLAALTLAAAMFVACSDDSGTGANDNDVSSSSVITSDSTAVIPGSDRGSSSSSFSSSSWSSAAAIGSSSSSSSVPTFSSSSATISMSSSATTEDLASSSSTAKSSSSSKDPEPAEGSSSSSSTDTASSSSIVRDHAYYLADNFCVKQEDYKTFTDTRNGRSYYYLTISGKDTNGNANSVTVMAENLNIGDMVKGRKDQTDDTKIERYCYDNDTTNCDKYGGLYQWAEMMALPNKCNTESCADSIKVNHQGICPEGWRLLTYNDMYTIVHCDSCENGIKDVRASAFGGYNYSGFSLIGAGYNWNYVFGSLDKTTNWFYPVEDSEYSAAERAEASGTSFYGTDFSTSPYEKINGFSVRCVMVE